MELNSGNEKYDVTPLELFFDLIYAFALSQITERIISDLTLINLLKSLILFGAVYMIWAYTSWSATMINAKLSKSTIMILIVMTMGFFMNIAVKNAFSTDGYIFAVLYIMIQFGSFIWTLINAPNDDFREHFKKILIWQVFSLPFWIAGMFNSDGIRIIMWGIAVSIDFIGTWFAHPLPNKKGIANDLYFDDEHMLERCRLFRLIAFGEMIFSTGDAIKSTGLSVISIMLGCVSMVEVISLWTLSFGRFFSIIKEYRKNHKNYLLVSRYAINVLCFILFGIILTTVGIKYTILHPYDKVPIILILIVCSGPVIFFIAQGWYLYKIPRVFPVSYIISGIILIFSNIAGFYQPAWIYQIIVCIMLVSITYIDYKKMKIIY